MSINIRGIITITAAVLFGFAVGICADRLWVRTHPHEFKPSLTGPNQHADLLAEMTRRLKLDSTQTRTIGAIFTHYQNAIDSAWTTVQPTVRSAIDSAQMEIVNVLDSAQRDTYMEWLRRVHKNVDLKGTPWPDEHAQSNSAH